MVKILNDNLFAPETQNCKQGFVECYLNIGLNSSIRFLSLDYGSEGQTLSNFILFNDAIADFHPRSTFDSDPNMTFRWIDKPIFQKDRLAHQKYLIINSDSSDIEVYYRFEIPGERHYRVTLFESPSLNNPGSAGASNTFHNSFNASAAY